MSSVIVAKTSVILAFKFVISGTGVENTFSLSYSIKEVKRGDIRRLWWPGCWTLSPSPHVWKCCIQKPNVTNVAINTWHTILETKVMVKKKYVFIPHSFLVINVCNQGNTLCSPWIISVLRLRNSTIKSSQNFLSDVWTYDLQNIFNSKTPQVIYI